MTCLVVFWIAAASGPRLAVEVIFDQMRATDMERLAPWFGPNGFGGLDGRAAHYDALHPSALTETGPGHATLSTGAAPSLHGIVSNHWFDGDRSVYVTDDSAAPVFGLPKRGASANALAVPTLGDAMRAETGGVARVVAISEKDRAAILSAGRSANAVLWYEPELARFTSSAAFGKALPAWATTLAEKLPADSIAHGRWQPLATPSGLTAAVDAAPFEGGLFGWSDVFPHDLAGNADAALAYRGSPQAMHDTFTLALAAIDGEHLGADATPDLLIVSVSSLDRIGHWYGPGSLEHTDIMRRADTELRAFIAALDKRFGARGYVLGVSSDHGSSPPPERLVALGLDAGRVKTAAIVSVANAALSKALGGHPPQHARVLDFIMPNLFCDLAGVVESDRPRVLQAVAGAVSEVPGVAATYLADDLDSSTDPMAPLFALARFSKRSGAIFVRLKPRWIQMSADAVGGTDHGSPYNFDRRVPFYLMGPGVKAGRYYTIADTRDFSPSLAALLGVSPPDAAQGHPVSAVSP